LGPVCFRLKTDCPFQTQHLASHQFKLQVSCNIQCVCRWLTTAGTGRSSRHLHTIITDVPSITQHNNWGKVAAPRVTNPRTSDPVLHVNKTQSYVCGAEAHHCSVRHLYAVVTVLGFVMSVQCVRVAHCVRDPGCSMSDIQVAICLQMT
jgi:hypothetical protein